MFTRTGRSKRYGEKCGKARKTGLIGNVHELNKHGDVMPEDPEASSYKWTFGKDKATLGETVRITQKK